MYQGKSMTILSF